MPPPLQTSRLLLRPFELDDAQAAFEVLEQDPLVWEFDPGYARTYGERCEIVEQYSRWNETEGVGGLVIADRESGRFLGQIGLQLAVFDWPDGARAEVEIFYKLGAAWWGKGLAAEAATAVLQFARDQMHVRRIVAMTHHDNLRSCRLLERLKMRLEPSFAIQDAVVGVIEW